MPVPQSVIEEREKRKKSQDDINYIYNDSTKNEFKKNMSYIIVNMFLITILDFIAQISTVTFYLITGNQKFQVKHGNMNFTLIFNVIGLIILTGNICLILVVILLFYHRALLMKILLFITTGVWINPVSDIFQMNTLQRQ